MSVGGAAATEGEAGTTFVGRLLSMTGESDPPRRRASVAVRAGRIASVAEPPTTNGGAVLDFGDRPVMPAFVDPHVHFEAISVAAATMVDCRAPRHATVADVLQTLSDHVDDGDPSDWLVALGNLFFDQKLEDRRLPTRQELDSVSRTRPIVIRAGGHRSILNSKGLEISNVAEYAGRSGTMGGAVIEQGADGEPTGVIAELDKVLGLPEPHGRELEAALVDGARDLLLRYGVTSIGEISDTREGLSAMDALIADGRLPLRVSVMAWAPGTCAIDEVADLASSLPVAASADRFAIEALKLFCDGGYSARNAATRTPYVESDGSFGSHFGKVDLTQEQLVDALGLSDRAGLQLAVHANGERAQDRVCEAVLAAGRREGAPPVRVEHAGNLLTDYGALEAWRRAGIVPIPQPVFLYNFGEGLSAYLGDGIDQARFPFKDLLDRGWRISGSSDGYLGCEESQTNPLFSVWCCVARRGFHGEPVVPEQAVSVETALRMHTIHAAEALRQEGERGTIEPGKAADLIVLERDPREVPVDELPDVKVDFVYVNGEPVYERPGAEPPANRSRP